MSLTIRAHHVESAKALFEVSREAMVASMIRLNYVDSENHPFVDLVYRFKRLFERNARFKLKIGGIDVLCENCPVYHRGDCDPNKLQERVVGAAFLSGSYEGPLSDEDIVGKYNLDLKKTYTAAELRKLAGF